MSSMNAVPSGADGCMTNLDSADVRLREDRDRDVAELLRFNRSVALSAIAGVDPNGVRTVVGTPIHLIEPNGGTQTIDAGRVTFGAELDVQALHLSLFAPSLALATAPTRSFPHVGERELPRACHQAPSRLLHRRGGLPRPTRGLRVRARGRAIANPEGVGTRAGDQAPSFA